MKIRDCSLYRNQGEFRPVQEPTLNSKPFKWQRSQNLFLMTLPQGINFLLGQWFSYMDCSNKETCFESLNFCCYKDGTSATFVATTKGNVVCCKSRKTFITKVLRQRTTTIQSLIFQLGFTVTNIWKFLSVLWFL